MTTPSLIYIVAIWMGTKIIGGKLDDNILLGFLEVWIKLILIF